MKKKPKAKTKPVLVTKILKLPEDWVEAIDQLRGEQSFSDFAREALQDKIGNKRLSEMPIWGKEKTRQ